MSEEKSRKPASKYLDKRGKDEGNKLNTFVDTAFKQQRLKAWQPLLTPKTVLPTLFVAGIIFAPLGGLFLYESDTVNVIQIY